MDVVIQIGIGVIGGLLTAVILRFFVHVFDFVPRKLHDLGIGSSFEPFWARGTGDNYDHVLWIRMHNHSASPLYIIRAVYSPGRTGLPVYPNAIPSQKYAKGFEVKFGSQWEQMSYMLMPKSGTQSYVPLQHISNPGDFPQGKRGGFLVEYVHDGKTGIHRTVL